MIECTKCGRRKPATLEFFCPRPAKLNGLTSWCRDCFREFAKKRQARRRADPVERPKLLAEKERFAKSPKGREHRRLTSQIWNHKRRQRGLAGAQWKWSRDDWERCKDSWDHQCAWCGKGGRLEQDHFIGLKEPNCPGTVPWNILPSCHRCNITRHDKTPLQFAGAERLSKIRAYLESMA